MKRLATISLLVVYLCLSVGIHVDVDTCCKTVAGFTLFSTSDTHEPLIADDCCEVRLESCCTTQDHEEQQGCASDCVFIQVLSEEQFVAEQLNINPASIAVIDFGWTDCLTAAANETELSTYTYRGLLRK